MNRVSMSPHQSPMRSPLTAQQTGAPSSFTVCALPSRPVHAPLRPGRPHPVCTRHAIPHYWVAQAGRVRRAPRPAPRVRPRLQLHARLRSCMRRQSARIWHPPNTETRRTAAHVRCATQLTGMQQQRAVGVPTQHSLGQQVMHACVSATFLRNAPYMPTGNVYLRGAPLCTARRACPGN